MRSEWVSKDDSERGGAWLMTRGVTMTVLLGWVCIACGSATGRGEEPEELEEHNVLNPLPRVDQQNGPSGSGDSRQRGGALGEGQEGGSSGEGGGAQHDTVQVVDPDAESEGEAGSGGSAASGETGGAGTGDDAVAGDGDAAAGGSAEVGSDDTLGHGEDSCGCTEPPVTCPGGQVSGETWWQDEGTGTQERACPEGQLGEIVDTFVRQLQYRCTDEGEAVATGAERLAGRPIRSEGNCSDPPVTCPGGQRPGQTWFVDAGTGTRDRACPSGQQGRIRETFVRQVQYRCSESGDAVRTGETRLTGRPIRTDNNCRTPPPPTCSNGREVGESWTEPGDPLTQRVPCSGDQTGQVTTVRAQTEHYRCNSSQRIELVRTTTGSVISRSDNCCSRRVGQRCEVSNSGNGYVRVLESFSTSAECGDARGVRDDPSPCPATTGAPFYYPWWSKQCARSNWPSQDRWDLQCLYTEVVYGTIRCDGRCRR